MAAALLLDLLIFLVPILLIPLGLLRGGAREGLVGGGILLGWAVASDWTGAWGGALASLLGATPNAMGFLVACIVLVMGAGAGHAAGTIVGLPRPEADGRIAGAVLAWLNGVVFLTLALGTYGRAVGEESLTPIISRGFLTEAVIVHERWVLLGVALVVLGLIGTVFWVNAVVGQVYDPGYVPGQRTVFTSNPAPDALSRVARTDPRLPITEPYSNWPSAPRQRAINVPHAADAGKVEPAASRFRSALFRITPQADGERGRAASFRELFSQTQAVDVRNGSGDTPGEGPRNRPSRPRSAPPRRHPITGRSPGDLPGGSEPGTRPPPPASISEWIRISGLSNPMMAPPPKASSTPQPDDDVAQAGPANPRAAGAETADGATQPDGTPDRDDRSSSSS